MKILNILDTTGEISANLKKASSVLCDIADTYGAGDGLELFDGYRVLTSEALESKNEKDRELVRWTADCPHIYTRIQIAVDYLLQANATAQELFTKLKIQHAKERAAKIEAES